MKILREPLLHFVIAGAVLFGGYTLLDRGEPNAARLGPVHIGKGEVRWLRETFSNQWRRTPTSEELNGLVANLIEEELLAREARALGLDQNDTVVRRRLAQKLSFLVEDTSHIVEPTEEELRQYYSANMKRFRTEARVSFDQIFFNPERHQDVERDAKATLTLILTNGNRIDATSAGDALLLGSNFHDLDQQTLSNMFGVDFAATVFALKPESWSGPIRSGFGMHLVQVTHLSPAEARPFEDIRGKIIEEWRRQRESDLKASYLAKLRDKFGIVVDDSVKFLLAPEAARGVAQ